jgi:tRNA modification GTPase
MGTFAAVMTGKGAGAIATIALHGSKAEAIINKIFKPKVKSDTSFDSGTVYLGQICDENGLVDEVLIGCEGPDYFAINCHGNPLIAADIMRLLQKHGAEPVTAEEMLAEVSGESNSIAIETRTAVADAKTLEVTRIIMHQGSKGLNQAATDWMNNTDLKKVKAQAEEILVYSAAIKPLLFGAKIVLLGPPNSGKSTLLNCLAGKQKAIVTELQGTTRDWVSAECALGRIYAEVIDTAGIDEKLLSNNETVERAAQQKAKELLATADLILLVLDASVKTQETLDFFAEILAGKKSLTVLNKIDLPARFDASQLPQNLSNTVRISAKFATGCDELIKAIEQILGVAELDRQSCVCFTGRQEQLLERIISSKTKEQAVSAISELLNGPLE